VVRSRYRAVALFGRCNGNKAARTTCETVINSSEARLPPTRKTPPPPPPISPFIYQSLLSIGTKLSSKKLLQWQLQREATILGKSPPHLLLEELSLSSKDWTVLGRRRRSRSYAMPYTMLVTMSKLSVSQVQLSIPVPVDHGLFRAYLQPILISSR
jgi:hypothetical protein